MLLALASWTYYDTVIPLNKLTDAEEELVKLERAKDAAQSSLDATATQLEAIRIEREAASREVVSTRANLEAVRSESQIAMASLKRDLEALRGANATAAQMLESKQRQAEIARLEVARLKAQADFSSDGWQTASRLHYEQVGHVIAEDVFGCVERDFRRVENSDAKYVEACFSENVLGPYSAAAMATLHPANRANMLGHLRYVSEHWVSKARAAMVGQKDIDLRLAKDLALFDLRDRLRLALMRGISTP